MKRAGAGGEKFQALKEMAKKELSTDASAEKMSPVSIMPGRSFDELMSEFEQAGLLQMSD